MISVAQAQELILSAAQPLGPEIIRTQDAAGRVLTQDCTATRPQPPFASSAMDGFALRRAELTQGAQFTVIGESAAGHGFVEDVPKGCAVRIFTGAPVPHPCDTILIQENAQWLDPTHIQITAVNEESFVRPAGMDFAAGHTIAANAHLTDRTAMMIAAMNIPQVTVYRRPVIAVLTTGDELVTAGSTPREDQIIETNHIGITQIAQSCGATVRVLPILRDDPKAILQALDLCRDVDVVVLSGGASVGDHDFTAQALMDYGVNMRFHKIRMRPGKPLMFGTFKAQSFIGLPGNPVSAYVCSLIFLAPLLRHLQAMPHPLPHIQKTTLAHAIGPNGPREHYMRAHVDGGKATVFDDQDSSLLSVLAKANALIIRPPHDPPHEAGAQMAMIAL